MPTRDSGVLRYDYNPEVNRDASAGALQDVVWFIEDEGPKTRTDGDSSLQDQFYTATVSAGWAGISNVPCSTSAAWGIWAKRDTSSRIN